MARPAAITPEIGREITRIKERHPVWSTRTIAKALEPKLKGRTPGKTAISQYLREVYKPAEDVVKKSGIDEPWNMGTLKEHPLPADAIPYILGVQRIAANPVTIRRARWIVYLASLIKSLETLKDISFGYAYADLIADLSQQPFDTSEYDVLVRQDKYKELQDLLWGKLQTDEKNLMLLTAGEAQKVNAVKFEGRKAIGICQTEVVLGSKFVWMGLLTKRGDLDHIPKSGEVVILKNHFLLTKKQIQKGVKDER